VSSKPLSTPQIFEVSDLRARLPPLRAHDAHKYSFGRLQLVAGSKKYPGAARLCALGAFKAGCGYVCLETQAPFEVLRELPEIVPGFDPNCSAFVVGPGLDPKLSEAELAELIARIPKDRPLLLDGGALKHFAALDLKGRSSLVVTPHDGEFIAMMSAECSWEQLQSDRVGTARAFASQMPEITLLLKGSPSLILSKGQIWIMNRGNASMATAGQGDLLSGVVGAYLALGMNPLDSALVGASLCALIAEELSTEGESQGVLAHEVASQIPFFLKRLRANSPA